MDFCFLQKNTGKNIGKNINKFLSRKYRQKLDHTKQSTTDVILSQKEQFKKQKKQLVI